LQVAMSCADALVMLGEAIAAAERHHLDPTAIFPARCTSMDIFHIMSRRPIVLSPAFEDEAWQSDAAAQCIHTLAEVLVGVAAHPAAANVAPLRGDLGALTRSMQNIADKVKAAFQAESHTTARTASALQVMQSAVSGGTMSQEEVLSALEILDQCLQGPTTDSTQGSLGWALRMMDNVVDTLKLPSSSSIVTTMKEMRATVQVNTTSQGMELIDANSSLFADPELLKSVEDKQIFRASGILLRKGFANAEGEADLSRLIDDALLVFDGMVAKAIPTPTVTPDSSP